VSGVTASPEEMRNFESLYKSDAPNSCFLAKPIPVAIAATEIRAEIDQDRKSKQDPFEYPEPTWKYNGVHQGRPGQEDNTQYG
jgi:hypothetical protein